MAVKRRISQQLENLRSASGSREEKFRRAAELISKTGKYRWVGIYEVLGDEIAAVAWTGNEAPAHPRFPLAQGLCGAAVRSRAPVLVGDVTKDPRYLTTFGSTRAEIIVPIFDAKGAVLGLIDVESERVNAFGKDDQEFLRQCASILTGL